MHGRRLRGRHRAHTARRSCSLCRHLSTSRWPRVLGAVRQEGRHALGRGPPKA